jgi:two-component system, sensor histidine kinase LadS
LRSIFIPEEKMTGLISLAFKSLGLLLVLLILAGGAACVRAAAEQSVLEITAEQLQAGPLDLAGILQIAEDPDRSWTLEDAAADQAGDGRYRPYTVSGLAGSQSESAFWVKLELAHMEAERRDLVLELEKPHLSQVTFYWIEGTTGRLMKEVEAGRSLPFKERLVQHRNFIYPVSFAPESRQVIYMRIVTDSYLQLPMKLWTAEGFAEKEQGTNLALGIFYGVMLGIALFNLFLFVVIRERVYLYYVLFVAAFALLQAVWDGIAYQYLWPGWPGWEAKSNPALLVTVVLLALVFTHQFLSASEYAPRIGRLNRLAAGGLMVLLLLLLLLPPGGLATQAAVYGVAAGLVMTAANFIGVRFRTRASRYYAAAWLLLLAGALVNLLAAFKLLPLTAITLYAPRIGMGGEAMLLSMALADRYNTLKRAKQSEERQGLLLRELHEMSKTLTATYDLDRLLDYTVESFVRVTGCEAGCIVLESDEGAAVKAARGNMGPWTGAQIAGVDTDNHTDVLGGPAYGWRFPSGIRDASWARCFCSAAVRC